MDDITRSILMNRDAIAIDQDSLGRQGDRVSAVGPIEVWMRPLAGGDRAVGIFNRGPATTYPVGFRFREVGLAGPVRVRDVWSQKDLGIQRGSFSVIVPTHGVVLLRLSSRRQVRR
jgi:alpha-galactosidase